MKRFRNMITGEIEKANKVEYFVDKKTKEAHIWFDSVPVISYSNCKTKKDVEKKFNNDFEPIE